MMYAHDRSLVKKLANKPFVLLGVNSDEDRGMVKKVLQEEHLTWRSWWNGPDGTAGPISQKYEIQSWPSIFILDAKGIIRFTPEQYFASQDADILDKTIDKLLKEMVN